MPPKIILQKKLPLPTKKNLTHEQLEQFNQLILDLKSNNPLVTINLPNFSIGDQGAIELAEALSYNTKVENIDLTNCNITGFGMTKLANALEGNIKLRVFGYAANLSNKTSKKAYNSIQEILNRNEDLRQNPDFASEDEFSPEESDFSPLNFVRYQAPRVIYRVPTPAFYPEQKEFYPPQLPSTSYVKSTLSATAKAFEPSPLCQELEEEIFIDPIRNAINQKLKKERMELTDDAHIPTNLNGVYCESPKSEKFVPSHTIDPFTLYDKEDMTKDTIFYIKQPASLEGDGAEYFSFLNEKIKTSKSENMANKNFANSNSETPSLSPNGKVVSKIVNPTLSNGIDHK